MKHWKPIIALLILSPLLTELLTTNFPFSKFFQPGLFLVLATVGYGFPVLVIREIALRKNFGLIGLFFLGVMYGLYNEGLIAGTIFNPLYSPVDSFASYGLVGDIRIPWALSISFWHALYAVVYPIIFVHYLFPSHARESWINKKTLWLIGAASLAFGFLSFSNKMSDNPGALGFIVFILLSWLILWQLAKKFAPLLKISPEISNFFETKDLRLGFLLYFIIFFLPFIFSKLSLSLIFFTAYFLIATIAVMKRADKIREIPINKLVLIGLGGEFTVAFLTLLLTLPFGKLEQAASSFAFMVVFAIAILKMKKRAFQN